MSFIHNHDGTALRMVSLTVAKGCANALLTKAGHSLFLLDVTKINATSFDNLNTVA